MGMKKYQEAIEIFKFNIRLHPGSVKGYNFLSYAHMKNGNKELAIKSCKKLLEPDLENTDVMNRLKQLQSDTHEDEKNAVKKEKK
jgi:tetratricopeptide (TPR) repeat protein